MSEEEILNNAFALGGGAEEDNFEKVYDLMMGNNTERYCVGSWADEEQAKTAMNAIVEALKTADKARAMLFGFRVVSLTPEEKIDYLK